MPDLEPPPFLTTESRRIWMTTVEQLLAAGATRRVSPESLLAYVSAVATHRQATELIERTQILVDRGGRPVANPALEVQRQAAMVIARFAAQFGLNRRDPMSAPEPVTDRGRWCAEHQRWECTSPRSRGRGMCHAIAVLGLGHCKDHAGVKVSESPAHLLAVERQRNPLGGEPLDIGPAEALLWRVRKIAREVADLDEVVAALQREELVWGTVSEEAFDAGNGPAVKTVKAARLNTWLVLRAQREAALQSACEAALRANIEERLVRLAEQQGALIYRFALDMLGDFGIDPGDPRIPEILPRRLREITA